MTQHPNTELSAPMTGPLEGLPFPDMDNLPDYEHGFWDAVQNRELRIQQCSQCNKFRHLPVPMCPDCHSLEYRWTLVSGRGRVYSFVVAHHPVHPALREKAQVPYNICLVELEEQEGLRILTNLLNVPPEAIAIDMPVRVTFHKVPNSPNLVLPFFIPEAPSS